jgi:hypothetical protein
MNGGLGKRGGCAREKNKSGGWLPNSAANPLPTAFTANEIPLPARWANRIEVIDIHFYFDVEGALFGG